MQDIAHRMEELHTAIHAESRDMGIDQLEKIRGRMIVAAIKRPTRIQNMEAIFFDSGVYQSLHTALKAKDGVQARAGFMQTRHACMACHVAEKIGFINGSAVFKHVAQFPAASRCTVSTCGRTDP